MKFVNGLIPALKQKVRPLVDWEIHFDEIVSIAEKILTTAELTTLLQPPQKQKQFRQWSPGKHMQFQKSNHKLSPNVAPPSKKGRPHPEAKNSINFGYFTNAKQDNKKYSILGKENPVRDQLAKEGECFLYEKPGHMGSDCTTRVMISPAT